MPSMKFWLIVLLLGAVPVLCTGADSAQRTLFEAKYREVLRVLPPSPTRSRA